MPENIWTESQFPLDENHGVDHEMGVTFPVLVDWSDPQESPTQAVARLNIEVVEKDVLLRGFQDDAAYLHGFKILPPEAEHAVRGAREIVHHRCGTVVGTLVPTEARLGRLMEAAVAHECTAEALLYATKEGKFLAERAISLLDGADAASCSPEYLRALTELICDVTALAERKQEVAEFLWGTAKTWGDCPEI
jgi:hypothetical protein